MDAVESKIKIILGSEFDRRGISGGGGGGGAAANKKGFTLPTVSPHLSLSSSPETDTLEP